MCLFGSASPGREVLPQYHKSYVKKVILHMLGSAIQNQFSYPKTILFESSFSKKNSLWNPSF